MELVRDLTVACCIDGIGQYGFMDGATPKLYMFGAHTPPEIEGSDTQWVYGLVKPPRGVSLEINPLTGDASASRYAPIMHHKETRGNKIDIAEIFLDPAAVPIAVLTSDADRTDTTLYFDDTTLADTVVFVGHETIHVGTHVGGGQYTGCARGLYKSNDSFWPAGEGVYDRPPFIGGRGLSIIEIDQTQAADLANLTFSWRGYIQKAPRTSENGTQIVFSTEDMVGALNKMKVGKYRPNYREATGTQNNFFKVWKLGPRGDETELTGHIAGFGSTVRKPVTLASETLANGISAIPLQVDGAVVLGQLDNGGTRLRIRSRALENSQFGTDVTDGATEVKGGGVFELAAVSKELDAIADAEGWTKPSFTKNLDYPYHPLSIAAAILFSSSSGSEATSIFDVLNGSWSAKADWASTVRSIGYWTLLIEETAGLEVDHFYMGWDGAPVDVWETIVKKLMIPFGFFPVFDEGGRIIPKRLRLYNLDDIPDLQNPAKPLPKKLYYKGSYGTVMDYVVGNIGAQPWMDGGGRRVRISYTSDEGWTNSAETNQFVDPDGYELDFSVYRYDRDEQIIAFAGDLGVFRAFVLPQYEFMFQDEPITGATYYLGDFVQVDDPTDEDEDGWFIIDGARQYTINGDRRMAGMVVGRHRDYQRMNFTVDLMMTNFRTGIPVRDRAPSATVQSSPGANQYDVGAVSNFGGDSTDADQFSVGQFVDWVDPDGGTGTAENYSEILSIIGNVLTLDTTWSGAGTVPSAGDHIVLAPLAAQNPGVVPSTEERPFAFLCDSNGEITVNGGGKIDGDIYG